MWCVSRSETIGLITVYKATCRRVLILEDFLKTTFLLKCFLHFVIRPRGGSRAAATSKMESFVIIVNGWKL